jgi:hypothetical protein
VSKSPIIFANPGQRGVSKSPDLMHMNVYGMYDLKVQQHNNNDNIQLFQQQQLKNQLWLISLQLSIFNKTTYIQLWLISLQLNIFHKNNLSTYLHQHFAT